MCRNARAFISPPKVLTTDLTIGVTGRPDHIANAWLDYLGLAADGNGSTISSLERGGTKWPRMN
jgi:hypothetical protein